MKNVYKAGEVVFERIHPLQKIVITRYARGLYYGKGQERVNQNELVFFEWELSANVQPAKPTAIYAGI